MGNKSKVCLATKMNSKDLPTTFGAALGKDDMSNCSDFSTSRLFWWTKEAFGT